jgi:hypothetical protein
LRFSNTSFWHYGAKPLKIGEQSYTFLIFFRKRLFPKVPVCLGNLGVVGTCGNRCCPCFLGVPSDRAAKKHAKLIEQSYVYQSLLPFSGFCAGPISK